ncbi:MULTISPECIES: methylenetetrahydrofolate reductase [unclassified Paenibacillus]|uniref:methylenetetrahydrofolate reductase n=1 Tax=unclassified Paenibacillus TaxID=185978 RepID=UPI002F42ED75
MLKEKILRREPGILTYGMTPPKHTHTPEKIAEISQKQCERLHGLQIDGLILYDVQEESDRIDEDRPFPYLPTIEPTKYSNDYLSELQMPKIIYRCVGKNTEEQFTNWLQAEQEQDRFSVFVGASSSKEIVNISLADAYKLSSQISNNLTFGGVVIPERHMKKNDEHLRIISKINSGCRFFISQATYNVEASKNFLSDYYYYCKDNNKELVPILFNLAPCGSAKTLEFMKWLGISIPKWLDNDLKYSVDVLEKSVKESRKIFEELFDFGLEKGIPIGCSIESLSTRKVEIEASIQLVHDIRSIMESRLGAAV